MAERTIAGFSSTVDRDYYDEIVEPGAFDFSLEQWKAGRAIPLVDSHLTTGLRNVIGHLVKAKASRRGLHTTFEVAETIEGDRALALAGGAVTGLSIGYNVTAVSPLSADDKAAGLRRRIKSLDLMEISMVIFPANDYARIDAVAGKPVTAAGARAAVVDRAELKVRLHRALNRPEPDWARERRLRKAAELGRQIAEHRRTTRR